MLLSVNTMQELFQNQIIGVHSVVFYYNTEIFLTTEPCQLLSRAEDQQFLLKLQGTEVLSVTHFLQFDINLSNKYLKIIKFKI